MNSSQQLLRDHQTEKVQQAYGGRTANTSGGVGGDETEDLFDLLSAVKVGDFVPYTIPHLTAPQERHPDVRGVSVGAIMFRCRSHPTTIPLESYAQLRKCFLTLPTFRASPPLSTVC